MYVQPWQFQQQVLDDVVAQGHTMAAIGKTPGFAGMCAWGMGVPPLQGRSSATLQHQHTHGWART